MINLRHKKVLLVEDDISILEAYRATFEMIFDDVLLATSGNEAVRILKENPDIDIILTDMNMPDGNGTTVIDYVINKHKESLLIVASAYTEMLGICKGSECVICTTKPINVRNILRQLRDFYKGEENIMVKVLKQQQEKAKAFLDAIERV